MFAHTPGNMCGYDMTVLQFNPEHGIRQGFDNGTLHFNDILFCHATHQMVSECAIINMPGWITTLAANYLLTD